MRIKTFLAIGLLALLSAAACGTPEKEKEKAQDNNNTSDAQSEVKAAVPDDGICEDSERETQVYCDGKDMIIKHADRACSKFGDTTFETVSCFKYEQIVEEAAGFSYIQKGICSEASGKPTCILDTEYPCSESFTKHEKCYKGYKISYWNIASCGEAEVEKNSPDCVTDSE